MKKLIFCLLLLVGCSKNNNINNPSGKVSVLSTATVISITTSTAISGGNITSDGGAIVTARGVCWRTGQSPTINDSKTIDSAGIGSFVSILSGLMPNTKYYLRAYATNVTGTGYGNELQFMTLPADSTMVSDIEGNLYRTATIGTQVWMVENLKTTTYNDGTPIPMVSDSIVWTNLAVPGYCYYKNDAAKYKNKYGVLYNWFVVNTGKLAPKGWHVPTDDEWKILEMFLGMSKSQADSIGARGYDESRKMSYSPGFGAIFGCYRDSDGGFLDLAGYIGYWWSSSVFNVLNAWFRQLSTLSAQVYRDVYNKKYGFSVRCVKD